MLPSWAIDRRRCTASSLPTTSPSFCGLYFSTLASARENQTSQTTLASQMPCGRDTRCGPRGAAFQPVRRRRTSQRARKRKRASAAPPGRHGRGCPPWRSNTPCNSTAALPRRPLTTASCRSTPSRCWNFARFPRQEKHTDSIQYIRPTNIILQLLPHSWSWATGSGREEEASGARWVARTLSVHAAGETVARSSTPFDAPRPTMQRSRRRAAHGLLLCSAALLCRPGAAAPAHATPRASAPPRAIGILPTTPCRRTLR